MSALTDEERRWIESLRRVARRRPPTLGLWGGIGDLCVVALTEDGSFMHGEGDGEHVCFAATIAIPAGGGDPYNVELDDVDRPWVDRDPAPALGDERGAKP